ncbi:MAG: Na+/H+ antiporter subunit E [Chthoniobacterales bacterium]
MKISPVKLLTFPFRFFLFLLFYAKEILLSNFKVAWDVITPGTMSSPGIIALPLDAKSDIEILTLANLITMTPGTLSLDVSTDRKTLYVHSMYLEDAKKLKKELKENFESRVINLYSK